MNAVNIRAVCSADVAAIVEIYGFHVRTGTASFELAAPTSQCMQARVQAIVERGLPYLIAETEGRVAGYAYAGPYRTRPAYRHAVENSVYVADWAQRRGIGSALLSALIDACERLGKRQMVAIIGDSAHTASIELHRKLGFRKVGTLEHVGYKLERWLDSVIMQRPLGPGGSTPPG